MSFDRCIHTWWHWRRARRTSKASARSRCAPWSAKRCGCGQIGSGSLPVDHLPSAGLAIAPLQKKGAGRLVVGEVRGPEVVDLMAALNTGHAGGCGTMHANSAADLPPRIEALALAAGLPRAAAHSQFAAALDVVIHLDRDDAGRRRIQELAMPKRTPSGLVEMETALRFDEQVIEGPAAGRLEALLSTNRPKGRTQ